MKAKKKKTRHMMIRLPEELMEHLEAAAIKKGIGASTLVRMIVIEAAYLYIEERKAS